MGKVAGPLTGDSSIALLNVCLWGASPIRLGAEGKHPVGLDRRLLVTLMKNLKVESA